MWWPLKVSYSHLNFSHSLSLSLPVGRLKSSPESRSQQPQLANGTHFSTDQSDVLFARAGQMLLLTGMQLTCQCASSNRRAPLLRFAASVRLPTRLEPILRERPLVPLQSSRFVSIRRFSIENTLPKVSAPSARSALSADTRPLTISTSNSLFQELGWLKISISEPDS